MADPFVPVVAAEQTDLQPEVPDLEEVDDEHSKQIKESENQYYIPYARLAIEYHNIHHKTRFEFKYIEKIEKKSTEYDELFITFQVTDKNADAASAMKTFQANVICDTSGCISGQPKVIFKNCSLEPTTNKGDHSSKDSESVIPIASPSTAGDSESG